MRWDTVSKAHAKGAVWSEIEQCGNKYRVTTGSDHCNTQPQSFCDSLENAKKESVRHIQELHAILYRK